MSINSNRYLICASYKSNFLRIPDREPKDNIVFKLASQGLFCFCNFGASQFAIAKAF